MNVGEIANGAMLTTLDKTEKFSIRISNNVFTNTRGFLYLTTAFAFFFLRFWQNKPSNGITSHSQCVMLTVEKNYHSFHDIPSHMVQNVSSVSQFPRID